MNRILTGKNGRKKILSGLPFLNSQKVEKSLFTESFTESADSNFLPLATVGLDEVLQLLGVVGTPNFLENFLSTPLISHRD